jgi:hypothetical protein
MLSVGSCLGRQEVLVDQHVGQWVDIRMSRIKDRQTIEQLLSFCRSGWITRGGLV